MQSEYRFQSFEGRNLYLTDCLHSDDTELFYLVIDSL
jgi:hypothetical protein